MACMPGCSDIVVSRTGNITLRLTDGQKILLRVGLDIYPWTS